jgi:Chaperone of endosialidase
MAVPYTFGTATASIPLSQLDSNFATVITLGNTAIQLGNTVTTLNNMTLANVTISSGNVTLTNVTITTANVTTANVVTLIVTGNETVQGNTTVTGTITGAKLIPTGSSVTGNGLYLPAANSVGISTNGTNAVYIDSTQKVGIGAISSGATLAVTGTLSATGTLSGGTSGTGYSFSGSAPAGSLALDSSGNLGLGVTPSSAWASNYKMLQAGNNSSFGNASSGTYIGNNWFNDGTNKYLTGTNFAALYSQVTGVHAWYNAPSGTAGNAITFTQAMTLTAAGELLVGKTATGTSNTGVQIWNAGGTIGVIQVVKSAAGTQDALQNYHSGTYVGGITYSNTATALVASSDERLKENITAAPSALEKAMDIEVVSYDWKHDPTHVEYGFVAQRLNNIYPEAVNVGDDKEEIEKTWGVEYGRLTPLLLKAIQEQQAIITALTARITALETT